MTSASIPSISKPMVRLIACTAEEYEKNTSAAITTAKNRLMALSPSRLIIIVIAKKQLSNYICILPNFLTYFQTNLHFFKTLPVLPARFPRHIPRWYCRWKTRRRVRCYVCTSGASATCPCKEDRPVPARRHTPRNPPVQRTRHCAAAGNRIGPRTPRGPPAVRRSPAGPPLF